MVEGTQQRPGTLRTQSLSRNGWYTLPYTSVSLRGCEQQAVLWGPTQSACRREGPPYGLSLSSALLPTVYCLAIRTPVSLRYTGLTGLQFVSVLCESSCSCVTVSVICEWQIGWVRTLCLSGAEKTMLAYTVILLMSSVIGVCVCVCVSSLYQVFRLKKLNIDPLKSHVSVFLHTRVCRHAKVYNPVSSPVPLGLRPLAFSRRVETNPSSPELPGYSHYTTELCTSPALAARWRKP